MPKNAETAKNTTRTVFAPRFLHASLVRGFGARPSKKTGKNHVTTDIQPRANGRLASRKRRPFLGLCPKYFMHAWKYEPKSSATRLPEFTDGTVLLRNGTTSRCPFLYPSLHATQSMMISTEPQTCHNVENRRGSHSAFAEYLRRI